MATKNCSTILFQDVTGYICKVLWVSNIASAECKRAISSRAAQGTFSAWLALCILHKGASNACKVRCCRSYTWRNTSYNISCHICSTRTQVMSIACFFEGDSSPCPPPCGCPLGLVSGPPLLVPASKCVCVQQSTYICAPVCVNADLQQLRSLNFASYQSCTLGHSRWTPAMPKSKLQRLAIYVLVCHLLSSP